MAVAPAVVIEAPPLTPPANGLLNSAPVIDQTDERWTGGVSFSPEGCGGAAVFDLCDFTFDTSAASRAGSRSFLPFGVFAYDKCSSFGFQTGDYEGRARRILAAAEHAAVEREFWLDNLNLLSPHLASGNSAVTTVTSGAVELVEGLAKLVQGISDNRLGQGMIHARPSLVTKWSAHNLLYREGRKLYTYTGTLVVPGSGYPGTGPTDQAISGTSEWAFATEVVQVMRGPVRVPTQGEIRATLNRTTNEILLSAQRIYSVQFNACAIVAAQINPTTV